MINLFYFLNSLLKKLSKDLSINFKIKILLACIHDKQILFNDITILLIINIMILSL